MTIPAADSSPWICPTCNSKISTPYCPACGEQPLNPQDLTFHGLVNQLFPAFSSIDSRLIRSIRCLVRYPGALSVAYVRGQRIPYTGPFQLFLVANVLFFAMQSLTSTNIVSTPLDSHLHNQDWSALAQQLVSRRLEEKQITLDLYAPVFNQAVAVNAKSFIILMVVAFTLLLPVVFYHEKRPFVAHVVFSLHLYAFLLLLFCISLMLAAVDLAFSGPGLESAGMDNILSILNLAACIAYLFIATSRVYGATGVMRAVKAGVLAVAAAALLLGYRFVIFLITLYTT